MLEKSLTRFGETLAREGLVSADQWQEAIKAQAPGESIVDALLRTGSHNEGKLLETFASFLNIPFVDLTKINISNRITERINAKTANFYKVIPVASDGDSLTVAMADPLDVRTLDDLEAITRSRVRPALATRKDLTEGIRKYYGLGAETIEDMMSASSAARKEAEAVAAVTSQIDEIGSEASISKFLNQMLLEAYRNRATDIHIEPFENELKIRYRIDGALTDAKVPKDIRHFHEALNSRIKIMASLDIAEKRLPQDGRFRIKAGEEDLDLRVSFLPTPEGQSVAIRILNSMKLYSFEDMGISADDLAKLDGLLKKPHGIIFLTGPTGSGKTTTLYACLSRVNSESRKIITIEDPIEYQLRGITQVQVHPSINLTFANALRSMLRHDPNIMMVGEVRDFETAQITIQVALTGHLVFSTLHTNDAASGITRLLDMGIDAYLIASAVESFIAQRLIRTICPRCKIPATLTPDVVRDFGLKDVNVEQIRTYTGKGCEECRFTGFSGREAICEFLMLNDEIRSMIIAHATAGQIKEKAVKQGMKTLRQRGWEKVLEGKTTPEEIMRVTHETVDDTTL
jgi:type II secretory ATPase GspE/PulE/Tfp pilus assembly ATPase PilB-like protein